MSPVSPAVVVAVPSTEDRPRAPVVAPEVFSERVELTPVDEGYSVWVLRNHGDEAIVGLESVRGNPAIAGFFEQEQPDGSWAHVGARGYSRAVAPPIGELPPGDSMRARELYDPTGRLDYLSEGRYRFVIHFRRASVEDEVLSVSARFDVGEQPGSYTVSFP